MSSRKDDNEDVAINDREQTLNRSSDIRVSKVKVLLLYLLCNYYEKLYIIYICIYSKKLFFFSKLLAYFLKLFYYLILLFSQKFKLLLL